MARRTFTRRAQVPRRQTEWAATTNGAEVAVVANTHVVLLSFGSATMSGFVPCTLVRSRGQVSVRADGFGSDEECLFGLGLAVIQDRARLVGPTAVPRPILDASDDSWLWHSMFPWVPEPTGVNDAAHLNPLITIDSKAMRKCVDGESVVLVAESVVPVGTGVIQCFGAWRQLFKLH